MTGATRITVGGESPYDVVVGRDVVAAVEEMLGPGVQRVLVVRPPSVKVAASRVADAVAARADVLITHVPDREQAKTIDAVTDLWATLGANTFTRSDAIIAVGGGATTDVVGFVASTWLRGVPVIHVPTTLLGMVDAAIGGKTAINTEDGKNLVGSFYPPVGVVCDLELLATLPREDVVDGMAEVVKAGFVADPGILDIIEADPDAAIDVRGDAIRELVTRAVRFKADVVSADLRESGGREILNYGHTLAHAIEKAEKFVWRHGHAVSVGMLFAAEVAHRAGRLDEPTLRRHRQVLESLGLPTSYDRAPWPDLRDAMRVDKKTRGDMLRLIVLDGLARPGLLEGPHEKLLESAFAEVSR